jgi:hypothetical protein
MGRESVKRAIQDQIVCVLNQPRGQGGNLQLQQMALGDSYLILIISDRNSEIGRHRVGEAPVRLDNAAHFRFPPLQGGPDLAIPLESDISQIYLSRMQILELPEGATSVMLLAGNRLVLPL